MKITSYGMIAVLSLCLVLLSKGAWAGIVATTGITIIAPPDTLLEGYLEDNGTIFLFTEHSDTLVTDSFVVDISQPATYTDPGAITPATLTLNSPVSSYYIHFDPVASTLVLNRSGSITFDETVLGIVLIAGLGGADNSFIASDGIFGVSTTVYASADSVHGVELSPFNYRDAVSLSVDRLTVTINRFGTDSAADEMRIITSAVVTGARGNPPVRPELQLLTAHPNPFNPATTLRYILGLDAWVSLAIFDAKGRHVVTLLDRFQEQGPHSVIWNGRTAKGTTATSGVYLAQLESLGQMRTTKLVLLR